MRERAKKSFAFTHGKFFDLSTGNVGCSLEKLADPHKCGVCLQFKEEFPVKWC
jgi:hypothetical protein